MRRPTRFTRTLRGLTALLAVWCLGCSAYDPLIAALVPGSSGRVMICAADEAVSSAGAANSGTPDTRSIRAPSSEREGQSGATCGCDSCHAPAAASVVLATVPSPLPHQPTAEPAVPPSVDFAPLVPPPQQLA